MARQNAFFSNLSLKRLAGSFLGFLLFCYFALHLVQGERGWIELRKIEAETDRVAAEYDRLDWQKKRLEHRVVLLRPPQIDADLLDEQLRSKLGYLHPDEHVLVLETSTR
ncbi:MAG: septum formation initiator family protein [Micavibrio sp.]|nr:MAG: septum formation initiator family protein [Micavibrio sp.]